MLNQFYLLIYTSLIASVTIAILSPNWILIWITIELNLLCFIPIIISSSKFQETEAIVKYFLIQALGSRILLMTRIFLWTATNIRILTILILSLIIKIGLAPFHIWYPSVMSSISWINCFLLSSVQKLAPIIFLTAVIIPISKITTLIAIINALVGGLLGINQTKLRTIIAYSSITHLGWIIALILCRKLACVIYFTIYTTLIIPLFYIIHVKNLIYITIKNTAISQYFFITLSLLLLSLSGIPPLTGFAAKWIAILILINTSHILLLVLIIGSLIRTYYYLSLLLTSILSLNSSKITNKHRQPKLSIILTLAITSLMLPPYLFILYAMNIFNKS